MATRGQPQTGPVSSSGVLRVGPLRYLMVRPELLGDIQKGVEDRLGPKAPEYLYSAAAAWAGSTVRRLREALAEEGEELARLTCRHASELGWGSWRLERFDAANRNLTIWVGDSPFAEGYGSSDAPICHLLAGAVAGMAEAIFRVPAACSEQACAAQGAPACLFYAVGHDVAGAETWEW